MSAGCKLRSGYTVTFEAHTAMYSKHKQPQVVHLDTAVEAYEFVQELRSIDDYVAINEGQLSFYHLAELAEAELKGHSVSAHY